MRPLPVLRRALTLRCPRCGGTPLFRGWFEMAESCALCGLRYERAQGYWVGAIYVNYGATTAIALTAFFLTWPRVPMAENSPVPPCVPAFSPLYRESFAPVSAALPRRALWKLFSASRPITPC